MTTDRPRAHPPETTEGWYALHQVFAWDGPALSAMLEAPGLDVLDGAERLLTELATPSSGGWTSVVPLIGSSADVMLVHFRPTLDDIGEAQRAVNSAMPFNIARKAYTFLSVTEAGLYHASAQLAAAAEARGGAVGDEAYRAAMDERVEQERGSAHVKRRLFPVQPPDMPYVCFYPMSKRRAAGQNWYALSLEERSRLMSAHGATGRGYAGKVVQVITGAIGFDVWEWGVTLFAGDPLMFKKLVTDMRFDEVSAEYAEFGEFFVGKTATPGEWLRSVR